MSDRVGQTYAITVLTPIRNGHTLGVHHVTALRALLASTQRASRSPFADLSIVHTARLLVIDDLVSESLPGVEDHVASRYLLLVADVDGDLPAFVRALLHARPAFADDVWGCCEGWPGAHAVDDVVQYFRDCAIDTALYFSGYPGASVRDVLRALHQQRAFVAFTAQTRRLPPGELQAAFREFRARMEKAPTPVPASP
jgi:hypothetical protein